VSADPGELFPEKPCTYITRIQYIPGYKVCHGVYIVCTKYNSRPLNGSATRCRWVRSYFYFSVYSFFFCLFSIAPVISASAAEDAIGFPIECRAHFCSVFTVVVVVFIII
jgi:hypothetical protein